MDPSLNVLQPVSASASTDDNAWADVKRRRRTTKREQSVLEALYAESRTPSTEARQRVCEEINMSMRKLQVWLQNRRQKEKKDAGKWKPSYSTTAGGDATSDATTLERTLSSCSFSSSSSSSSSSPSSKPMLLHETPEIMSCITLPPISRSVSPVPRCSSATGIRLPSIHVMTATAATALPAPRAQLQVPARGLHRSLSLPIPAAQPSQPTKQPQPALALAPAPIFAQTISSSLAPATTSLARTSSEPGKSNRNNNSGNSMFGLNVAKDGRAIFGPSSTSSVVNSISINENLNASTLSPVSAAVLSRRHSSSNLSRSTSFTKPLFAPEIKTESVPTSAPALWDNLDSDPIEPEWETESDSSRVYASPARRNSVRMEDILSSARKGGAAAMAGMRLVSSPASMQPGPFSENQRMPLGARSAVTLQQQQTRPVASVALKSQGNGLQILPSGAASLAQQNKQTGGTGGRKRTFSKTLHRSVSLDNVHHAQEKENYPTSAFSSSSSLSVTRPALSRTRSYQDTTSSTRTPMETYTSTSKRARTITSGTADSSFDDGAEPDLTFSTTGSKSFSFDSDSDSENDDDSSMRMDGKRGRKGRGRMDSGNESSSGRTVSTAATSVWGSSQESVMASPGGERKVMSQMERDVAAVLAGLGGMA